MNKVHHTYQTTAIEALHLYGQACTLGYETGRLTYHQRQDLLAQLAIGRLFATEDALEALGNRAGKTGTNALFTRKAQLGSIAVDFDVPPGATPREYWPEVIRLILEPHAHHHNRFVKTVHLRIVVSHDLDGTVRLGVSDAIILNAFYADTSVAIAASPSELVEDRVKLNG